MQLGETVLIFLFPLKVLRSMIATAAGLPPVLFCSSPAPRLNQPHLQLI